MRNLLWIFLLCLSLVACVDVDDSTLMADDNGVVHRTISYLRDSRGRNYFPEQIPGTGNRQFIFDPKAAAWAEINRDYAEQWPNITRKGEPPADADAWKDVADKAPLLSPKPAAR